MLNRYTDLEARDYAELLHLGGDWGVGEVAVHLAHRAAVAAEARKEGAERLSDTAVT